MVESDQERLARLEEWRIAVDRRLSTMVTEDRFWPVRAVVYGLVGSLLLAIVGAVIKVALR